MVIDYPTDKTFELRVEDTGTLDHFDVFVNGTLRSHVSDGELHAYELAHPDGVTAIAVHFEGVDGGESGIIDVTDPNNPSAVASQNGLVHSYLLRGKK